MPSLLFSQFPASCLAHGQPDAQSHVQLDVQPILANCQPYDQPHFKPMSSSMPSLLSRLCPAHCPPLTSIIEIVKYEKYEKIVIMIHSEYHTYLLNTMECRNYTHNYSG